jgi:hypothetical protein
MATAPVSSLLLGCTCHMGEPSSISRKAPGARPPRCVGAVLSNMVASTARPAARPQPLQQRSLAPELEQFACRKDADLFMQPRPIHGHQCVMALV